VKLDATVDRPFTSYAGTLNGFHLPLASEAFRILYVTNGITGSGGLERVLSIKASLLADDHACDVMITSLNENVCSPFYKFSNKVHLISLKLPRRNPIRYLHAYQSELQKVINDFKPNVICVCDDALKGFLLPFVLKTKAKLVYERHSSKDILINGRKGFGRIIGIMQLRLMELLGRKFDVFVVLSAGNAREWSLNTRVIPNPLSFFPVRPALLETHKVIAVGRQAYAKGYEMLLPAWRKVLTSHPDWVLEIYGKKDPGLRLTGLAKELGIADSVRFLDPVVGIESKFLDASVCVLSSRFEGFGMVLIEAMACGVPCVAFDCPHGPSDIIESGVDGWLVPAEDIENLSLAICNLVDYPRQRKLMGAKARINVKRYAPEVVVGQWLELFSEIRT
jgi:glycosyltransferase involved in cell wall biosynthesis